MCHGHPRRHPCSHMSTHWHYCPSALIDLDTRIETPCQNQSFAKTQPSSQDCPLTHCNFTNLGGSWTCCMCGQGPNTLGWCTMPVYRPAGSTDLTQVDMQPETCDHGCCERCTSTEGMLSLNGPCLLPCPRSAVAKTLSHVVRIYRISSGYRSRSPKTVTKASYKPHTDNFDKNLATSWYG